MSGRRDPDAVIKLAGMEMHGFSIDDILNAAKQKAGIGADRTEASDPGGAQGRATVDPWRLWRDERQFRSARRRKRAPQ